MHRMPSRRTLSVALLGALLVSGCSAAPAAPVWTYGPGLATPEPVAVSTPATATAARVVEVHRDPLCSCCHEWEAYLRAAGWEVRSVEESDMNAFKRSHDLPETTWSCHTGLVDGYVVEGHVPLAAIEDLLEQRPAIDGIALAGMPPGSPGMPGEQAAPFDVVAVDDGVAEPFGAY